MDTRRKIVDPATAIAAAHRRRQDGGKVAVMTGSFDVLLADHARELAAMRNGADRVLVVAVLAPATVGVLSDRARAEMLAGLAVTDYVVVGNDSAGIEELLAGMAPDVIVRREAAHEDRLRWLVEHVRGGQSG